LLAKIDQEKGNIIFEARGLGTLPSNDRKEMEHLQLSHLEKIRQMVDNNDRCISRIQLRANK
jgi:hypothetical protein